MLLLHNYEPTCDSTAYLVLLGTQRQRHSIENLRTCSCYIARSPGKELISFLGCANVRAFHENPYRIHTELTFINP